MLSYLPDIKALEKIDRPREKLKERGVAALTDQELLAVIIGNGTRQQKLHQISLNLLLFFNQKGIDTSFKELIEVAGLGESKACRLLAAVEFSKRKLQPKHFHLNHPKEAIPLLCAYADKRQEHFICIELNGAYELIQTRLVSIGLLNRTMVHPREVFADAIKNHAGAIIVAHNHPSGNLDPSEEDIAMTQRLKQAGQLLGIPLLDHIIFSAEGYFSFLDHKIL